MCNCTRSWSFSWRSSFKIIIRNDLEWEKSHSFFIGFLNDFIPLINNSYIFVNCEVKCKYLTEILGGGVELGLIILFWGEQC